MTKIIVLLMVLLTLPQNSASAGFYDWLVSKNNSNDLLVRTPDAGTESSDNFYLWTRSIEEAEKKEL
ncbi:MAG: hypothetical protein Q8R55_05995, partial [Candidatus Taylorbacteria bacterium]|nr:hypothetical protein [Candidatus Taylorbacteria bacterium]